MQSSRAFPQNLENRIALNRPGAQTFMDGAS
jgi:hypothetical protein